MGMKHYTLAQWELYSGGLLSNEERSAYETHLSTCDPCLELYMQSLERAADSYPALNNETALAEAVMERIHQTEPAVTSPPFIPSQSARPGKVRKTPAFTRHPLFHYTVAAAITVILMSSGAFQSLTERMGHFGMIAEAGEQELNPDQDYEQSGWVNGSSSISYKIMEKTIVMLDSIQPKHEKGGTR